MPTKPLHPNIRQLLQTAQAAYEFGLSGPLAYSMEELATNPEVRSEVGDYLAVFIALELAEGAEVVEGSGPKQRPSQLAVELIERAMNDLDRVYEALHDLAKFQEEFHSLRPRSQRSPRPATLPPGAEGEVCDLCGHPYQEHSDYEEDREGIYPGGGELCPDQPWPSDPEWRENAGHNRWTISED